MERYVIFDIETTGFSPENHKITEIGAVKVENGSITETFSQLINPKVVIPEVITQLTGISNATVCNMPTIDEILPSFIDFCEGYEIMGHNILFDFSFIKTNAMQQKLKFEKSGIDTLEIARNVLCHLEKRSLTYLCDYYHIEREHAHRAFCDAQATYELYLKMKSEFYNENTIQLFKARPIFWKPQKQEAITEKQFRFLSDLVARNHLVLVKPIESYSKSEASREIDLIINQHGK